MSKSEGYDLVFGQFLNVEQVRDTFTSMQGAKQANRPVLLFHH